MNRSEQVLEAMRAQPERGWTSARMSVELRCAPAMARKLLLGMVRKGDLTLGLDDFFRLADAPPPAPDPAELIHALLSPIRELTPCGIATDLGLTEDEALTHLAALYRAGRIDLWASLPASQEEWDERRA